MNASMCVIIITGRGHERKRGTEKTLRGRRKARDGRVYEILNNNAFLKNPGEKRQNSVLFSAEPANIFIRTS